MEASDSRRIAVVTGGTGALGRWIVRELAGRGFGVRIPRHTVEAARDTRAFLEAELGDAATEGIRFRACDITDPEEVEGYFRELLERDGRVDVLVNAVGGFAMAPVEETDPDLWRRMMDLNARSAFLFSRACVPAMKERERGRIVTVASFPALERGAAKMAAYGASKAALLNLTRSLADELREHGITANAVVPRIIDTPANRRAMPEADRSSWLQPVEVARVVAFLAGEDAGVVSGAAIPLEKG